MWQWQWDLRSKQTSIWTWVSGVGLRDCWSTHRQYRGWYHYFQPCSIHWHWCYHHSFQVCLTMPSLLLRDTDICLFWRFSRFEFGRGQLPLSMHSWAAQCRRGIGGPFVDMQSSITPTIINHPDDESSRKLSYLAAPTSLRGSKDYYQNGGGGRDDTRNVITYCVSRGVPGIYQPIFSCAHFFLLTQTQVNIHHCWLTLCSIAAIFLLPRVLLSTNSAVCWWSHPGCKAGGSNWIEGHSWGSHDSIWIDDKRLLGLCRKGAGLEFALCGAGFGAERASTGGQHRA